MSVTSQLRVAVLQGGPSSEAAVSRVSAAAISRGLTEAGHGVTLLELDERLAHELAAGAFDVVFPALHGPVGEDGCVQGLLEVMGLPYVGAAVLASALAASKPHAKRLFAAAGLPVVADAVYLRGEDPRRFAERARELLGPALVVKPASGGSAIGVTRIGEASTTDVVVAALEAALAVGDEVLVERFSPGLEATCGVLEDEQGVAHGLPPTLILAKSADWYDFTSRYAAQGSEHRCPAPFGPALIARMKEVAVGAHRALGVRDLCRVDMVVRPDDAADPITLLEVNTLPGMTPTSLFPEEAAVAGIPFADLCDRLVRRAAARPRRPTPNVVPMPA
jgi:D-alanine-D-alanine ligase